MKVTVIGSDGQLGSDLVKIFTEKGEQVTGLTHDRIEVSDLLSCQRALGESAAAVVINTAAFLGVDECEKEPEKAFTVNTEGAFNVAKVCQDMVARCVFISTDYVFSGESGRPYLEEHLIDPINIYGVSKAAGEIWVRGLSPKNLIIRTSGLYGEAAGKKGWNFVEKMIRAAQEKGRVEVVNDRFVSPTFTHLLAEKIYQLVENDARGTFHLASSGFCSWHDFTSKIFEFAGINCEVVPVSSAEFPSAARRPAFSVLESSRLASQGFEPLPKWDEALRAYLEKQGHLK